MRARVLLGLIAATLAPSGAWGQTSDSAGPLAGMDVLTGTWRAEGSGFETTLEYRWLIPGHVLAGENDVRDDDGAVIARYRGAYAWDAARNSIVFWTAAEGGEIHRGRAWWQDGVLWHEAEVTGGEIRAYVSAVRPAEGRLDYFADYGAERAGPELLEGDPLAYTRVDDQALAGERFIVLLRLRHDLWARYEETGVWPDDPAANEALRGHVEYWKELYDGGKVILAGGMGGQFWDNVAQIVLNVTDREEAEAILAADPAIRTHVFKAQLRPFTVHMVKHPSDS